MEIEAALYRALMRYEFIKEGRSFTVMAHPPKGGRLPNGDTESFSGNPLDGTCTRTRKRAEPPPFMQIAARVEGVSGVIYDPRACGKRRILGWVVVPTEGDPVSPTDLPATPEELQRFIWSAQSDGEDPTQPKEEETAEYALAPFTPDEVAAGITMYASVHGGDLPRLPANLARLEFGALPEWARTHYLGPLRIRCEDLAAWYETHGATLGWPRPAWLPRIDAECAENVAQPVPSVRQANIKQQFDEGTPPPSRLDETARPTRKRGRPPGSGLQKADERFLEQMHQLMLGNSSLQPYPAAMRVAELAEQKGETHGSGTIESTAKRLVERYSEKFSNPNRA